jgi:ABC-2 type transport system permease protein/oleandomycin transport system permease protein
MLAWRNLLSQVRDPQAAVFMFIQPVMFVLMFRYVFGGAIQAPGGSYVDFLMPGIFVQTMVFGGIATAVGLADDLKTGFVDRLRSMPMAGSVVLTARTLSDTARNVLVVAIMGTVGLLVGWRPEGSALDLVAAFGLLLLFGFAMLWLYALVGLSTSSGEAAQAASFPVVFPLVFASSVFVPTDTMPGWLQVFAEHQPISVTAEAIRGLTAGTASGQQVGQALAWTLGLLAVLVPLAAWRYRRRNS